MNTMGRLLLIVLPLLAALAFFLAQQPLGGIAPAPPVSVPGPHELTSSPPRSARRVPTILAPQPGGESATYPPGTSAEQLWDGLPARAGGGRLGEAEALESVVIPIPDLSHPGGVR